MNKRLRKLAVFLFDETHEVPLLLLAVFSLATTVYTVLAVISLMTAVGLDELEKARDFAGAVMIFTPSTIVILLSSALVIGTYVYSWLHDYKKNTSCVPVIHQLYILAGYRYDGRRYERSWLESAPWPITVAFRVAGLVGLLAVLVALIMTFPTTALQIAFVSLGLHAARNHIRKKQPRVI